ncbi:hypothetical protein AOR_1_1448144 [Paecilomyces variotii No. 5]|uniref:Rhodopsin domain-containing protein n=1 Tax=Byssochlamys spectabilis (strain No. 5 / NBRC 109023) TaxID=1356009 RepID=V5FU78_BYSSN|nr:hypothetical protein AOR_1_1448144 [Paecilomyces variotii No. 5]
MASIDLSKVPGMAPPPGEHTNFIDPPNQNKWMYLTASVCLSLSVLAVIFRMFVKVRVLKAVQLEEYILICALMGLISWTGIMIKAALLGQGVHMWNVPMTHVMKIIEYANIIECVYCPTILGAKVAMLLQIKRIFVVGKKGTLYWLHEVILWLNVPTYLGLMLSFIFSCVPREKIWNPEIPGRCASSSASLIASSVLNVLSDVSMLILPVAVIMQLQLPTKSKIVLSVIFGTGVLSIISSVVRLIYSVLLTQTEDFTRAIMPVGLWAIAEVTSVTLSGAIPLLPGFVKFVRNGQDSSGQRSGGGSRWGPSYGKGSKIQPLSSKASISAGRYYPMDSETEAIVHADAMKEGDDVPLGIMKTVQVQATYQ